MQNAIGVWCIYNGGQWGKTASFTDVSEVMATWSSKQNNGRTWSLVSSKTLVVSLVSYEIVFYCKCIHLKYVKMISAVWKDSISFPGSYKESFKYINLSIFESMSPRFQLPKFGNCLILFFSCKTRLTTCSTFVLNCSTKSKQSRWLQRLYVLLGDQFSWKQSRWLQRLYVNYKDTNESSINSPLLSFT